MSERLAVLEVGAESHEAHDAERFDSIAKAIEGMNARLDLIDAKLSKQKGFIGGVVFVVSAVWALIATVAKLKFGA
jgi:hypothetical protein